MVCCKIYSKQIKEILTLKMNITTTADDMLIFFSEKIRFDISYESFALQMIHMKVKSYFLGKTKSCL